MVAGGCVVKNQPATSGSQPVILILTRQVNVLVKNAEKLVKKMIYTEIHIQYIYVEIVLMNYGKE